MSYTEIIESYESGELEADIINSCPLCQKKSHLLIKGKEHLDAVEHYLKHRHAFVQDLPFDAPVREFIKSGFCHDCMYMIFGKTSDEIKYVQEGK